MPHLHWFDLQRHPDSPELGLERICVGTVFNESRWQLVFEVFGAIDELQLPDYRRVHPGQSLWEHSCFEMFVSRADHQYREFNFAPDGAWQAIDFNGYRSDPRPVREESLVSDMRSHRDSERYRLHIDLKENAIPDMSAHVGLSCVMESVSGERAFWALEHPAEGEPDFHHPKSFRIPLR